MITCQAKCTVIFKATSVLVQFYYLVLGSTATERKKSLNVLSTFHLICSKYMFRTTSGSKGQGVNKEPFLYTGPCQGAA